MIWTIVIVGLFVVGLVFKRTFRRDETIEAREDTGLAIMEFGRAYPSEAIREIISTEGGRTVFLRLYDGRVGCMHAHGHHYTSHLIEPGAVRVTSSTSGKGLAIEFIDGSFEGGTFEFKSSTDAAEVSLWLLGSLMPSTDPEEPDRKADGLP